MTLRPFLAGCAVLAAASSTQVAAAPMPVTFKATDGVIVHGLYDTPAHPKALLLLFHQAGSSKAEYATIAPRLVAAGFGTLAVDQRSGGSLYGPNETAAALGRPASYDEGRLDLEAALAWGVDHKLPVALWGSSYSAALVLEVAAAHPRQVAAVLAFSPGEYLDNKRAVGAAAAKLTIPLYVTSAANRSEVLAAADILKASPSRTKVQYQPQAGIHGSSTLIRARDPEGAAANWTAVLAFLRRVFG